jgi:hypothetical protein
VFLDSTFAEVRPDPSCVQEVLEQTGYVVGLPIGLSYSPNNQFYDANGDPAGIPPGKTLNLPNNQALDPTKVPPGKVLQFRLKSIGAFPDFSLTKE